MQSQRKIGLQVRHKWNQFDNANKLKQNGVCKTLLTSSGRTPSPGFVRFLLAALFLCFSSVSIGPNLVAKQANKPLFRQNILNYSKASQYRVVIMRTHIVEQPHDTKTVEQTANPRSFHFKDTWAVSSVSIPKEP